MNILKRLKFKLILLSMMMLVPLLLACQSSASEPIKIGVVNLAPILDSVFEGFKIGMTEQGYIEGEDVYYIYDGPVGSIEQLEPAVQALLDAEVDLILSLSTPAAQAAQRLTLNRRQTPVIFAPVTDPIEAGIVESLSSPGGNITGVTFSVQEARRLEWLLKLEPTARQVYIPYNPEDGSPVSALKSVSEAASKLGLELVLHEARNNEEITEALKAIPLEVDAFFLLPDSLIVSRAEDFIRVSQELKVPLSAPVHETVEAGALYAYGFEFSAIGKQAARLASQVLQDIPPADLPVETAEFFLTINLQSAKAIGLELSDDILQQANTIIR